MRRFASRMMFFGVVAFLMAALPSRGESASITYQLTNAFNGTAPTSTPPWLTATFTDTAANTVSLVLASNLNVASEYFSDVNFNFNPAKAIGSLLISNTSKTGTFDNPTINIGANSENLQGGGAAGFGFDVNLAFDTSNSGGGSKRFNGADTLTLTLSMVGLTAADFAFVNTGSAAAHVGAHVQGIPTGQGSGAIRDVEVPEPASLALFGVGIACLASYRLRRQKTTMV